MTKLGVQRLNLVGDCAILFAASASATVLPPSGWHWMVFLGMATGAMLLWTAGCRVLRHYDVWNGRGVGGDVALTGLMLGGLFAVMAALRWVVPSYAAGSELWRFACVVIPAILWLRLTTSWVRRRERPIEQVLIVGIGPLGRHTGLELVERGDENKRLFGYLRYEAERPHSRLPAPLFGTAGDLEELLKKHVIDDVFLAGQRDAHHDEMQAAIRVLERLGVPFALPAGGFRFGRARPVHERALSDGYIHYLTARSKRLEHALKRAIDIAVSAAALSLCSPLLVAVALAIKLTSRGTVLFPQERVGLHGRRFRMLKFRSMVVDAEKLQERLSNRNEQSGPVFKIARDPRVTSVGRFIRKYSIDELPQLLNVLRGDMSLVGPRPPLPSEVARYDAWQRRRLSVRPGLTCVWQVSGRNQIGFEDWMYLDMQYIDHWSLAQDVQLLVKTVPVVLSGRGAS